MITKRIFFGMIMALTVGVFNAAAQEVVSNEDLIKSFTDDDLVVIIGGSGRTGRLIAAELAQAGIMFRPTARDPEKAKTEINSDYSWVAADVTDTASLAAALKGATYVISAVGNPREPINVEYQGLVNSIEAAKKERVKHFTLISSAGVTHEDHYLNHMFNDLLKWKFKGEEHLRRSGLPYTIVRPYGLVDALEGRSANTGILFLQGDDAQNGVIARADVARVCVVSLVNPWASRKTIEVTNFYAFEPDKWPAQFAKMAPDPIP